MDVRSSKSTRSLRAVYAIAALLLLVVFLSRLTGWLWRWLREPIRLVVAAAGDAGPGGRRACLYAPAIAVTVLDLVFAWATVSAVANLAAAEAPSARGALPDLCPCRWLYRCSNPRPAPVVVEGRRMIRNRNRR